MAHEVRWAIVGLALLGSAALRAGQERPAAPEVVAMDGALRLSLAALRAVSAWERTAPVSAPAGAERP